ncbi:MAG TPA: type VI secretion system baseplate subunit TssE [Stellaceae bacterium]|jgi:type VI secretion system protein ImpF|nr:type VI secretion system baseplate subunit TssE [Stellaceae bacterium]
MISRTGRDRGVAEAQRAQLPLLDRLIDDAPDVARDAPLSPAEAIGILRRGVRRDIEALLNARRRWRSWPQGYTELEQSPVGYGISDFAAGAFNDPAERDRLRIQIEQTIRRFEPRLAQVRVVLVDADNTLESTLRLRIEALLRVEPAPEPIVFDTLVDPATAEVQVKPNSADRASSDV